MYTWPFWKRYFFKWLWAGAFIIANFVSKNIIIATTAFETQCVTTKALVLEFTCLWKTLRTMNEVKSLLFCVPTINLKNVLLHMTCYLAKLTLF